MKNRPSWTLLDTFDHLLFLADGKLLYSGSVSELPTLCAKVGHAVPAYENPADHVMRKIAEGGEAPAKMGIEPRTQFYSI